MLDSKIESMPPTNPGSKPPRIKEPKEVKLPNVTKNLIFGGSDWILKNFAVGTIAYALASLFSPHITNYAIGPIPSLTEEEKKELAKEKKILEDAIGRIQKRQEQIGGIIVSNGTTDEKRFWGAPIELLRRTFGLEEDKDPSVKVLRLKLNSLDFKNKTYSALKKLTFWLAFVIAAYYLADPIEALVANRRNKIKFRNVATQTTEADKILYANDLELDKKIQQIKKEYLELIKFVVEMQQMHINGDIDQNQFEDDLTRLKSKLVDVLQRMEEFEDQQK